MSLQIIIQCYTVKIENIFSVALHRAGIVDDEPFSYSRELIVTGILSENVPLNWTKTLSSL